MYWLQVHQNVILGAQHDLGDHFDLVPLYEGQPEMAYNGGHNHPLFIHGKVLSNTVSMTSGEGKVGIRISTLGIIRVESQRIKLVWVLPNIWMAMN